MNLKQKAMIKALKNTLGVVTLACEVSGVSRSQHYKWINCSQEYRNAVTDIEDIALDFAESKLHGLIKNNDTTATIFFLKTKGKRRGYIEKIETGFTDNEGNDVKPFLSLPIESLSAIEKIISDAISTNNKTESL